MSAGYAPFTGQQPIITRFTVMTAAEYAALTVKSPTTLYIIIG